VTRFAALPTAGILGFEHRKRKRRALRLSAPQPPVSPAAASMPQNAPRASSAWGPSLVTAFPSPATTLAFASPIPGSKVPTCYFAPALAASTARSARSSATDFGFAAAPGCILASRPLRFPQPAPRTAPPASTPLRDCYIPPDQSVPRNLPSAGPPSDLPDFRLLPAACSITRFGCGSSFPVRYVSEARCSSNLLEPHSLCAWMASASRGSRTITFSFPQYLSC
jgi:hypothetical protein